MFKKILIANRGEIACRIIRTAKHLGIKTVAVYSAADKHALHVKMADEAYYIGPAPSSESYLDAQKILQVAQTSHAEAIHPGYGFLSENADFVEACQGAKIRFIGPSPDAIRKMGEKHTAKAIMEAASVPVIPGYHGPKQDPEFLKKTACKIGFPVLIKAVAGGGGKGMRVVEQESEFEQALHAAKSEAKTSFGDDVVLLEKYLSQTRHVEVQVFADAHGNAVYLFERDCSIQRRHQKVLEEAPAPGMTDKLRKAMGEAAVNAARAIHYEGAGTIEFLLTPDHHFYFMEMNTRLQVEHPITEKITGLDLVEWQLRVADSEPLPVAHQSEIKHHGHAIEARIYAENPEKEFTPSTGKLAYFSVPEESQYVRIDTGVVEGDDISIYYDPLIAKLIVWDEDRERSVVRLRQALAEFHVAGVHTNISLLTAISESSAFGHAELDTHFIQKNHAVLLPLPEDKLLSPQAIALATIIAMLVQQKLNQQLQSHRTDPYSPWFSSNAWKLNLPAIRNVHLKIQAKDLQITAHQSNGGHATLSPPYEGGGYTEGVTIENVYYSLSDLRATDHHVSVVFDNNILTADYAVLFSDIHLFFQGRQFVFKMLMADNAEENAENSDRITAPMPGTVVDISVIAGQEVKKGQRLVVIEAMKMQHTLYAPDNGMIKEVLFNTGDLIDEGTELVLWEGHHA